MFVGIDVSKTRLDVALRPSDKSFSVANNQRGIATLVKRLKKLQISRVVLEASGGYEIAVASELAAVELPLAVLNPRQVEEFARATGRLARSMRKCWRSSPILFSRQRAKCLMRRAVN